MGGDGSLTFPAISNGGVMEISIAPLSAKASEGTRVVSGTADADMSKSFVVVSRVRGCAFELANARTSGICTVGTSSSS